MGAGLSVFGTRQDRLLTSSGKAKAVGMTRVELREIEHHPQIAFRKPRKG